MRGTPGHHHGAEPVRRIIPAHAGNSRGRRTDSTSQADHPRACGELIGIALDGASSETGSSPRMRGTPVDAPGRQALTERRIIPAHAGNSQNSRTAAHLGLRTDHPRACGELSIIRTEDGRCSGNGSSPRMRGTHSHLNSSNSGSSPRMRGTLLRIHSANDAGSSPRMRGTHPIPVDARIVMVTPDHPRACGELVGLCRACYALACGSSPRMRGTPA